MHTELIGFIGGLVAAGTALAVMFRHERWRAIRTVYGGFLSKGSPGNALIWPSR